MFDVIFERPAAAGDFDGAYAVARPVRGSGASGDRHGNPCLDVDNDCYAAERAAKGRRP